MQDQTILIEQHPGYRVITLHRPQRLNAFSEPMHQELRHAIDEAEGDAGCRALLLTGYGRAFCAGQDLNERLAKDGKTMVLGSALDESWSNDLDAQLDLERESQREAALTPDFAEGVHAFLQKRPPAFMSRRE